MTKQPLVSIIIPTFNRAHLIGETLDSVIAQTYQNWECIVVDDGSTDGTDLLMESYCAKDFRFQYHHRPEDRLPGGNAARNYGFEVSKGEYIQWLDSDDCLSVNKLEVQINRVTINSSNSLLTCKWARFKNLDSIKIKSQDLFYKDYSNPLLLIEDLGLGEGLFPPHTYIVHRTVLSKSGLWNESLFVNQDGEFFSRVIINCSEVLFAANAIAYYRFQTGDNTSINSSYSKMKERIRSWKLIQGHLLLKTRNNNSNYVKRGKLSCYKKIKRKYPFLLIRYFFFFKNLIIKDLRMKIQFNGK